MADLGGFISAEEGLAVNSFKQIYLLKYRKISMSVERVLNGLAKLFGFSRRNKTMKEAVQKCIILSNINMKMLRSQFSKSTLNKLKMIEQISRHMQIEKC